MLPIDKRLDDAWSLLVKLRAKNRCEFCGIQDDTLSSHHIHTRSNKSVRWDVENGVALCYKHHVGSSVFSAHGTPDKFDEWITGVKGVRFMERLNQRKNSLGKFTKYDKELMLQLLREEIKNYDT